MAEVRQQKTVSMLPSWEQRQWIFFWKTNRVVGYKHGEYVDFDIDEALNMEKGIPQYQYDIAKELALLFTLEDTYSLLFYT